MQTLWWDQGCALEPEPEAGASQDRKSYRYCETTFGAISEEIHKTFIPGDISFEEFSYAHEGHNQLIFSERGQSDCKLLFYLTTKNVSAFS